MDPRIGRPLHVDVRSFLSVNSHVGSALLWSGILPVGLVFPSALPSNPFRSREGFFFSMTSCATISGKSHCLGISDRSHFQRSHLIDSIALGTYKREVDRYAQEHRHGCEPERCLKQARWCSSTDADAPFGDADFTDSMYGQGTLRGAKLLKVVYEADKLERVERKTEQSSSYV